MIDSVNTLEQTVLTNNNVIFSSDAVRTRCASCCGFLNHTSGSGLFQLTKPGIYEIDFNANATSATASTIQLGIRGNGEVLQGSQMTTTATANSTYNLSAKRLVRLCGNSSLTITVANIGTGSITIANPNIIIKKVA